MNRRVAVAVTGLVTAAPLVLSTLAAQWAVPKCELKPGHFLVNSGILYLVNASKTKYEDQKVKDLRDAERVLTDAITRNGQDQNPAAWYYLARRAVVINDLPGADTAFARAEALAPRCKDDIQGWRKTLWTPIYNKGVRAYQQGAIDSALYYFKAANAIQRDPSGLNAIGSLYATRDEVDSAVAYYAAAAAASPGSDTLSARVRREALFNRGAVLNQARRWQESEAAFREYLAAFPNDVQAMAGLATAFAQTGRRDSALAAYRQVLAQGDSAELRHLFQAGVEMYNAAPQEPDSGSISERCVTERRARLPRTATQRQRAQVETECGRAAADSVKAARAVAEPFLREAAAAFESVLKRSAADRNGLFNLTNTYYRLYDGPKMLATAQRLYAVDPMSRNVLLLLAQSWRVQGKTDSTLHYLSIADSGLTAEVAVLNFVNSDQGATWSGSVTSRKDQGQTTPFKLTVEFLDNTGGVVITQSVDVPALDAGATAPIEARAVGKGILAWRYRRS